MGGIRNQSLSLLPSLLPSLSPSLSQQSLPHSDQSLFQQFKQKSWSAVLDFLHVDFPQSVPSHIQQWQSRQPQAEFCFTTAEQMPHITVGSESLMVVVCSWLRGKG